MLNEKSNFFINFKILNPSVSRRPIRMPRNVHQKAMLKYGMAGPAIPCQVTIQPTFGFLAIAGPLIH